MGKSNKKVESYRLAFKKYGVSPRALQWGSKKAAEIRYKELTYDLDFEGKTILDVGCGFGDIIPFIFKKTKNFSYTGVDLVPEFIEIAQKTYPKHNFFVRDYFGNPLKEKFDIIITSGTLNANINNALKYRTKAIKIMFDHARQAVAFNMAGSYPQPENNKNYKVYYANSSEILNFCFNLSKKIILRHHYHTKDFTIVIFKE